MSPENERRCGEFRPWGIAAVGAVRARHGQSEALSSYFVRLAVAHAVPTQVFVALLPDLLERVSGRNVLARRRGVWMNGAGEYAREVSACLARLTCVGGFGPAHDVCLERGGCRSACARFASALVRGVLRRDARARWPVLGSACVVPRRGALVFRTCSESG